MRGDDCALQDGGRPVTMESYHDAIECTRCGVRVRWDMADDALFGFEANCPVIAAARPEPEA